MEMVAMNQQKKKEEKTRVYISYIIQQNADILTQNGKSKTSAEKQMKKQQQLANLAIGVNTQ